MNTTMNSGGKKCWQNSGFNLEPGTLNRQTVISPDNSENPCPT